MRWLLPASTEPVDLTEAYAYPEQKPWLRANMIGSVDGAAWRDGHSGGLGSAADRRVLSLLRGLADVIIVGAETARVEGYGPVQPRESRTRLREQRTPAPPLAVVSGRLDLDLDSPLFTEAAPYARTIVITTSGAGEAQLRAAEKVADVIVAGADTVDLRVACEALTARGHTRLLTEGGPRLLAQVAATGMLDELCLTVSPMLLAGDAARILHGDPLDTAIPLRLDHVLEDEGYLFLRYVHTQA